MRPVQDLCAQLNLAPRTLIEVGAAHPAAYRLGHYVEAGFKVILIEANPRLYYCLTKGFNLGDFQDSWPIPPVAPYTYAPVVGARVEVINAAITDQSGTVRIYERNASSFIEGVNSPARQNDGYIEVPRDAYEVLSLRIDQVDDGEVDVLLADVEGCEWYCIKNLVSRPRLIILEMSGGRYVNPFGTEIRAWMVENGYVVIDQDDTDVAWGRVLT